MNVRNCLRADHFIWEPLICKVPRIVCSIPFHLFVCAVSDQRITHVVKDQCFDLIKVVISKALFAGRDEECELVFLLRLKLKMALKL